MTFFPFEILLYYTKWQMRSFCEKKFHGAFVCDQMTWLNGGIDLQNVSIEQSHAHIFLDHVTFKPRFFWTSFLIGGDLEINQAKIICRKKQAYEKKKKAFFSSLFRPVLNISLQHGYIELEDPEKQQTLKLMCNLEEKSTGQHSEGIMRLFFLPDSKPCEIYFKKSRKTLVLESHFHEHPAEHSAWVFRYFFEDKIASNLVPWICKDGTVNGICTLTIGPEGLRQIDAKLSLKELQCENPSLVLFGGIQSLELDVCMDFTTEERFHQWNGDFVLEGGRIAMSSFSQSIESSRLWNISDVNTHFCVRNGEVKSSSIKGYLMGMEGEMTLDWSENKEHLVHMDFHGDSRDVAPFLGEKTRENFKKAFPNDLFHLVATVKRKETQLELKGQVDVQDQENHAHHLNFGCLLGASQPQLEPLQQRQLSFSDSIEIFLEQLKEQFCLSQRRLGWINGKNFSLDKFLSPFLLSGTSLKLSGMLDFEALFDDRCLAIFYDVADVTLGNAAFCIASSGSTQENKGFNLEQTMQLWQEKLPSSVPHIGIKNRKAIHYFDLERKRHVGFLPIVNVSYEQKKPGLYFTEGQAVVCFENQKISIREIKTHWNELPLMGTVDLDIHSIEELDLTICVPSISGPVQEAQHFFSLFGTSYFWNLPLEGNFVSDLQLHFLFQPKALLKDGKMTGHFDTFLKSNPALSAKLSSDFVYNFKPSQFVLKNGKGLIKVSPFQEIDFILSTVAFNNFPNWDFQLICDADIEQKNCHVEVDARWLPDGRHFSLETSGDHSFVLQGIQTGTKIQLAEVVLGNWRIVGDVQCLKTPLFVCEISHPLYGECGLAGELNLQSHTVSGELQSLHLNLANTLGSKLCPFKTSGTMNGEGTFTYRWDLDDYEIQLLSSLENFVIAGAYLGEVENAQCSYSKAEGFAIENLSYHPLSCDQRHFDLAKLQYNPREQSWHLKKFNFSLPSQKIPQALALVEQFFPNISQSDLKTYVSAVKQNESLEGCIDLDIAKDEHAISLTLKDGCYHLGNKSFNLVNPQFDYVNNALTFKTAIRLFDYPFNLKLLSEDAKLLHGTLILSDKDSDGMTLFWSQKPEKKWSVDKVEGVLLGLECHLEAPHEACSNSIQLMGKIGLTPSTFLPFVTEDFRKFFHLMAISGRYNFEGLLQLSRANLKDFLLQGKVLGQDVVLGGVDLAAISSEVICDSKRIQLNRFNIKDWAGRLFVNTARFEKKEQGWDCFCDLVQIEELRFSRIRNGWVEQSRKDHPLFKALYLPNFVLKNVSGLIGKLDSFKAAGNLTFTNVPKKTLFSNILMLPSEITARIGLDLSTLIPAQGDIRYEIEDGKIYLRKFKKMYSVGKRSRFYLVDGYPSYIDFRGNLHLKVRMKQYNLLMKLAEFFTVTVKGSCLRPNYAFSTEEDIADPFHN